MYSSSRTSGAAEAEERKTSTNSCYVCLGVKIQLACVPVAIEFVFPVSGDHRFETFRAPSSHLYIICCMYAVGHAVSTSFFFLRRCSIAVESKILASSSGQTHFS